ncbi:MAG: hypothetical protein IKP24_04125 [Alphaproteobacteria bacterium]|nr:hypothetical protein [Alphaproteobacteria bacterium]
MSPEMITLTQEQKEDLIHAINDKKYRPDVMYRKDMREYTLVRGGNNYSIEAYNNQRRVIKYNGEIIADSATFGTNMGQLKQLNFILSLLITRLTTDVNNAVRSGKRR